jgi:hypothetical protein
MSIDPFAIPVQYVYVPNGCFLYNARGSFVTSRRYFFSPEKKSEKPKQEFYEQLSYYSKYGKYIPVSDARFLDMDVRILHNILDDM